ncbi:hypothetical protein BJV82DRAFT_614966 [Fennellomyces sp. T-0311]|nr:hypothetical protein BJV82DRAFT_614966 [Fennellomyces sp. T-0311]
MMTTMRKRLPSNNKDEGTSSRHGKPKIAWQRKQLVTFHRGADTAMAAAASRLLHLEKSASAMISRRHRSKEKQDVLSASEPVIQIDRDKSKLGAKIGLFERAIEMGWFKKVFRRNRAGNPTTIIPPPNFPNENTKSICALVEASSSADSLEDKSYELQLPIFEAFNDSTVTEEDLVEDPQDANPYDFNAYCDKILFGK